MTTLARSVIAPLAPASSHGFGPTAKTEASPSIESSVQASAESMNFGCKQKEKAAPEHPQKAESDHPGHPRDPRAQAPRSLVRAHLKAQLDERVEHDLVQITRAARRGRIGLLTTFIKEAPRDTPEMPEAMMRLGGKLLWENERELVVERFKEWEKKPVDQRGPAPNINCSAALARSVREGPSATTRGLLQYDLALYVDGFLATEQGKSEEAFERFTRILERVSCTHASSPTRTWRAPEEVLQQARLATRPRSPSTEGSSSSTTSTDLVGLAYFKSAWCYWRLGSITDEATRRFRARVRGDRHGGAPWRERGAPAEGARRAPGRRSAQVPRRGLHRGRQERRPGHVRFSSTKIRGDRFAGKISSRCSRSATYYDQAHYERGILEAARSCSCPKLEPTAAREAAEWILQIACKATAGSRTIRHLRGDDLRPPRSLELHATGARWSAAQADPQNVTTTSQKIEKPGSAEHCHLPQRQGAEGPKRRRQSFRVPRTSMTRTCRSSAKSRRHFQIEYYLAEIDFRRLGKDAERSDAPT